MICYRGRPPSKGITLPQTYTTTFGSTENPISESGIWVNGATDGTDWADCQTGSGNAYATVINGSGNYDDNLAHIKTSYIDFSPNQYAKGTVYLAGGYSPNNHEVELLLRFAITSGNAIGYEILWNIFGTVWVVRWNGNLGDFTTLETYSIGAPIDGDVLMGEISGDIISVYKNDILQNTTDITSLGGAVYSDGQPGIGFWLGTTAVVGSYAFKDFEAGNL